MSQLESSPERKTFKEIAQKDLSDPEQDREIPVFGSDGEPVVEVPEFDRYVHEGHLKDN